VQPQVLFELMIDDVGREQQRTLTELRELMRFDGRGRLRRRIDDDNFVGAIDELLRYCLGLRLAENTADEFLLLGDVLRLIEVSTDIPASSSSTSSKRCLCRLPGGLSYATPSIRQARGRRARIAGTSTTGTPPTSRVGMISSV
jgi:hypothetical protein